MTLVDNGFSINIFPLKLPRKLGIAKEDITPLTQGPIAYGSTHGIV